MPNIKLEVKHLLPSILHYAKQYMTETDFKVLSSSLKDKDLAQDYESDVLV